METTNYVSRSAYYKQQAAEQQVAPDVIRAMRDVEARHFRTVTDTGTNDCAMIVWNTLRAILGMPTLSASDFPLWNSTVGAYVRPPDSNLLPPLKPAAASKGEENLKYIVRKRDGEPVDPAARYVVLRVDDPTKPDNKAARAAALLYVQEAWDLAPEAAAAVHKLLMDTQKQ